jgi:PAS domain S-box-containing protein
MTSSLNRVALRTVLIVDDDQDIRAALTDLLISEGYEVESVGRGALAIQCVLERRFAAAILDIGLPDFDGLSILKVLMELDAIMPVIVLTGFVTINNTIGSLKKGAFAYLTKPYNQDEVRATVKRAVGVRELAAKTKDIQQDLHESLERFKAVVDSAPDAIVLTDSSGHIFSWNATAEKLFGYHSSEICGQPLTILMPVRYRQRHTDALFGRRAEGHGPVGRLLEVHGLKKDGQEFPIELSIASWASKGETFYSGIIRDITERKRAEAALTKSEERYRALYEDNPCMYFTVSAQGRVLSVNRFGAEQLGYRPDELVGGSVLAVFHPDDQHNAEKELRLAFADPDTVKYWEFRRVRKDGTVCWVRESVRIVHDSDRMPLALIVCEDVTERRRAQEALQRQERELSDFFDNGVLGHHWLGPDGTILRANQAELRMLGYRRDEYIGHQITEFHVDRHVIEEVLTRLQRGESVNSYEATLRCKDGSTKEALIDSNVLWDNGTFVHTRCFTRDISQQKRAEHRLSRMNECLLHLGTDSRQNIQQLLDVCRELMAATVALYYRREGESVTSGPPWQFPTLTTSSPAALDGALCEAGLNSPEAGPLMIRSLERTHYAQTDPNVSHLHLQTFLAQAVRSRGVLSGSLCLVYQHDHVLLPGDNKLLGILASAIGVEEARQRAEHALKQQERQLRQVLEEREQFSRDLHDGIIQSLYAVGLLLVDCQSTLPAESTAFTMVQRGTSQLNAVIREIRDSIINQHSSELSATTLSLALRSLVQTMNGRTAPKFHLNLDDKLLTGLSATQGSHVSYIVREALSNSLRHAEATAVTVSVKRANEGICLTIEDDGQGFDLEKVGSSCMGLRNIQARAEKLGTTVTIRSTRGRGTSILLHLAMGVHH